MSSGIISGAVTLLLMCLANFLVHIVGFDPFGIGRFAITSSLVCGLLMLIMLILLTEAWHYVHELNH